MFLLCIFFSILNLNNSSSNYKHIEVTEQKNDLVYPDLSNNFIWKSCFKKTNLVIDTKYRLREINGKNNQYVTSINKINYYKSNNKFKAYVVFETFFIDEYSNEISDCHACKASISIAKYELKNQKWVLLNFVRDWKTGIGGWGQGPDWTFLSVNNREIIGMTWIYGNQGNFEEYNYFYDVETLKRVNIFKK